MPKWYDGLTPWAQTAQQSQEIPPGSEVESATPARAADLVADLLVPLGQAAVTGGLLGGLFVFLLAEVGGFKGDLVKVWALASLAVAAVAWVILLLDSRRLLWALERVTGRDLDGDRQVGEPQERLVFLNRERARQDAAQARRADEWSTFVSFVKALQHRGTGYDAWESVIGRGRYVEYRDALIDYGLARWRSYGPNGRPNFKQGWKLTASPEDILERLECD